MREVPEWREEIIFEVPYAIPRGRYYYDVVRELMSR